MLLRLLAGLLLAGIAAANVQADSYDALRLRSSARLLHALLRADESLEQRVPAAAGLRVLIYADSRRVAEPLLPLVAPADVKRGSVRGRRVAAEAITRLPHTAPEAELPVAVFLASPLPAAQFEALLAWCIAHRVILYSPFEGDVERGATAGLSVRAKVQPFVNRDTLAASGIQLGAFYLAQSRVWP